MPKSPGMWRNGHPVTKNTFSGVFGTLEGWQPPQAGVCMCVSSEWQTGLSSLRYGHFLVVGLVGRIQGPDGPILGQTDTVSGANRSKHGQKRAQTPPKFILSINEDNETVHGAPWRHRDPFLAFWVHFGAASQHPSECGQTGTRRPKPAFGGAPGTF